MADSFIQLPPDSTGKRLQTGDRTIGGFLVQAEYQLPGEYQGAAYTVTSGNVSGAAADDALQIMAGAALHVRVRRIEVYGAAITAAAALDWQLLRLTSAGTGGTAATPSRLDSTGDVAAGATCAFGVPLATHGTAGAVLGYGRIWPTATAGAGGMSGPGPYWAWVQLPNSKPIIVPAGVTNGLALRINTGRAGAIINVVAEFVETAYL